MDVGEVCGKKRGWRREVGDVMVRGDVGEFGNAKRCCRGQLGADMLGRLVMWREVCEL